VVDLPPLLATSSSQTKSTGTVVREMFQEARLMDAVLVLDGYLLQSDGGGGGAGGGADDTALLVRCIFPLAGP
jgi:hypothetical protein